MRVGLTKSVMAGAPGQLFLVDYIGGARGGKLPVSVEGYQYIIVILDCFTRYPYALPLRSKTAEHVAEALIGGVFSHTSCPVTVHSDTDPALTGEAMTLVWKLLGIRKTQIAYRNPEGNAPVERFMRYLNQSLTILLPNYTQ